MTQSLLQAHIYPNAHTRIEAAFEHDIADTCFWEASRWSIDLVITSALAGNGYPMRVQLAAYPSSAAGELSFLETVADVARSAMLLRLDY